MSPRTISRDLYLGETNLTRLKAVHMRKTWDYVVTHCQKSVQILTPPHCLRTSKKSKIQGLDLDIIGYVNTRFQGNLKKKN
ncbi:hypothetical protein PanWU01x14_002950 [Parasponia andersonii]|uniref:Uncharacterized protein n=1 Tax=Parasponia andersonii TaxID=3476 RepID=A0A2P5E5D4_PARAD|nr:hypothetical protein PanWU01x14_002950 [Parasponia andersonii]